MQLEDYFIFLDTNDIRLKDTRIGIETVLYDYIYRSRTPEEIAKTYLSLSLEQVYATVLYYLHNKPEIGEYLTNWLEWGHKMREEQKLNSPPISEKLRQLRAERLTSGKSYANQVFDGWKSRSNLSNTATKFRNSTYWRDGMEVFDIFKSLDFILIGKWMAVELFLGVFAGIIVKFAAKFNASHSNSVQVFRATDYSSRYFGRNFPRGAFDPFKLPPEFIVVQYDSNEVISENFLTFLGDSTKAEYQNGEYRGHGFSALSSPVYLTTVVIPIVLGFFPALLPFINKIVSPLLFSGLAWMFITLMPMLFPFQGNETSNPE
jgi:uncharacterized protein (DUF433 family)